MKHFGNDFRNRTEVKDFSQGVPSKVKLSIKIKLKKFKKQRRQQKDKEAFQNVFQKTTDTALKIGETEISKKE